MTTVIGTHEVKDGKHWASTGQRLGGKGPGAGMSCSPGLVPRLAPFRILRIRI